MSRGAASSNVSIAGRWVNPVCQFLDIDRGGPFVGWGDEPLLTFDEQGLLKSGDEGKTWTRIASACFGQHPREPGSFYFLRTKSDTLVLVYLDLDHYKWNWDEAAGEPKEDCELGLWAIRSTDGGRTWTDKQQLLDGYNANFFGFIQTRSGRLVVVAEHLVSKPGRWVVCSFDSEDEGRSWRRSNIIDLGGHGHHDGATEPTVAELSDGRLFMLIRTSLGRFWQAFADEGRPYWRLIQPSSIDASSSPGYLLRLHSGRLFLVWNRANPAGREWPKTPPGPASEVPTSWHREELSIAFSEDDAKTWTEPVVIARQDGGQLSYPYVFERRPGELWIFAGFAFRKGWEDPAPLRLMAREDNLLRVASRAS